MTGNYTLINDNKKHRGFHMQDKIKKYIEEWKMIEQGDKLIVGVSGGADSVCLLSLLYLWREKMGFDIVVVHIHHGLREGTADKDEQYVRALCTEYELPLLAYRRNVQEESEKRRCSIEEAGREVRHEIFKKVREMQRGSKIVLAHHKNDNAETFLMNLARGTGIRGLKGIAPVNGVIVRPLLCVERLEIESYLEKHKIAYRIDETNQSNLYMRNRVRNELLPYIQQNINTKVVEHIDSASRQFLRLQEYLQYEVQKHFDKCVCCEDGSCVIREDAFYQVPEALRSFVIQRVLEQVSNKRKDISTIHMEDVEKLFDNQVGRRIDLPYAMQAVRVYEGVRLEKKVKAMPAKREAHIREVHILDAPEICMQEVTVCHRIFSNTMRQQNDVDAAQNIPRDEAGKRYTKQFDYDIIKGNVVVRTRQSGDYIVMNEHGNKQKIKDYFINQKVPSEKRDTVLLIADGSHVLWIVGYRTSLAYKVSERTNKILEIEIKEMK